MSTAIRKVTGLVTIVGLVALAWFAVAQIRESRSTQIEALFDTTVGLFPGSDVQMLGVKVGVVTAVEPEGGHVRVSMRLDPGYAADADTNAVIIAPTLVSDRFVQLTRPHDEGQALANGAVLDTDRTAVPVEVDDLYRSLTDLSQTLGPDGANANGALSDLLTTAAENLDGNGAAINQTIKEFGQATATLARSDEAFFGTLSNLKEFNDMLVANDADVTHFNRDLAAVADTLATDRDNMAAAIRNMAEAMAVLEEFIADNRAHLTSSIDNLAGPTQTLVDQKTSLEEAVRLIPLALQNFINAYSPESGTIDGRGNLNELSIWSNNGLTAQTSSSAPPVMLPGIGQGQTTGSGE